jgi:hypothetical protein
MTIPLEDSDPLETTPAAAPPSGDPSLDSDDYLDDEAEA